LARSAGRLRIQAAACGVVLVDRIVAGGDAISADGARGLEQLVELEVVVAERTGNGRAPGEVLGDKGADNILLKALLLVDDVVGNLEVLGHAPRVIHVVKRTTAARLGTSGMPCLPARRV